MADNKSLPEHDVRQSAYRGTARDSEGSGVPDGSEREVASKLDTDSARPTNAGEDRSGTTQPNFGQGGTYGATGEHAGGAHGKAATGGYHEDDGDRQNGERDDGRDKGT